VETLARPILPPAPRRFGASAAGCPRDKLASRTLPSAGAPGRLEVRILACVISAAVAETFHKDSATEVARPRRHAPRVLSLPARPCLHTLLERAATLNVPSPDRAGFRRHPRINEPLDGARVRVLSGDSRAENLWHAPNGGVPEKGAAPRGNPQGRAPASLVDAGRAIPPWVAPRQSPGPLHAAPTVCQKSGRYSSCAKLDAALADTVDAPSYGRLCPCYRPIHGPAASPADRSTQNHDDRFFSPFL